jgi:hypothetical protein
MLTKIALAAFLVLGPASAALANDNDGADRGGGPVQTWEDIARSAQFIQGQIKRQFPTSNAGADYGYVKPSNSTGHSSRRPTQYR